MDHLEEIRSKLSIEELVGQYVQLKKAGRNLRGLCPFHGEKTPSFMVSPEKGIAYCFGCHQGGDIFKFTQLVEKVEFSEAIRILADRTGIRLPDRLPRTSNKRLRNIEINQYTVQFFMGQLKENSSMMEYFLKRGLTDATIQKFKLGFAPDSFDRLKNCLTEKGYAPDELVEAAVVSQRSMADKSIYDRFRNRVIFPIFDQQDNPVAFSGRILRDGEPKYLNSPDTPAYNKSTVLYGLNWAKEAIKKENNAIIVEGYMDVITSHQAGTENVIATCGTALTPQQLKLLKRYTHNVSFAFDMDSAGMKAALRAIELAQSAELDIKIIVIPEGKDPDECIKGHPEKWKDAIENPVSVMDFYFDYAYRKSDKDTIEGKREIMDFIMPLIKNHRTEVEQGIYLNRLSINLKTDVKLLWNDLKNLKPAKFTPKNTKENSFTENKKNLKHEDLLLGILACYPEFYPEVADNLLDSVPQEETAERFYNLLKKVYTFLGSLDLGRFKENLSETEIETIDLYSLIADETYADFSKEVIRNEVIKLTHAINRNNLQRLQKQVEFKIRSAASPEEKKHLLKKYTEILHLRQNTK